MRLKDGSARKMSRGSEDHTDGISGWRMLPTADGTADDGENYAGAAGQFC